MIHVYNKSSGKEIKIFIKTKKKVINEQIEVSKNIYLLKDLLESIHADYGIRVNWFNLLRIYGTQK